MDQTNYAKQDALDFKWGCIHLTAFLVLIIAGIVVKRVFGHPEFMMAFHGPAAIFLVVGGMRISNKQRRRFKDILVGES
jgi:hypothetical protein